MFVLFRKKIIRLIPNHYNIRKIISNELLKMNLSKMIFLFKIIRKTHVIRSNIKIKDNQLQEAEIKDNFLNASSI